MRMEWSFHGVNGDRLGVDSHNGTVWLRLTEAAAGGPEVLYFFKDRAEVVQLAELLNDVASELIDAADQGEMVPEVPNPLDPFGPPLEAARPRLEPELGSASVYNQDRLHEIAANPDPRD